MRLARNTGSKYAMSPNQHAGRYDDFMRPSVDCPFQSHPHDPFAFIFVTPGTKAAAQ